MEIESSIIAINKGGYGGGLSVVNGRTDIYTDDLRIYLNRASEGGGGLYCEGSNNNIIMLTKDLIAPIISQNEATNGNGGGAYISAGCSFTSYSGNDDETSGISNNEATGNGGGLYARLGAKVYLNGNRYCTAAHICYGDNTRPVNLSGNTADSDQNSVGSGGAIYATGSGTAIYGNNLKVNLNQARSGSAVMITNGAVVQTQTTYDNGVYGDVGSCWSKGRCNQFIDNSPVTSNSGTVFFAHSGSQLKISRTHIESNQTFGGVLIDVQHNDSSIDLTGSYITGNGVEAGGQLAYVVGIHSGGSAGIANSTIADNKTVSSIRNNGGHLKIYSTIIHDLANASALWNTNPVSSDTDCLIVKKLGDISDPRSIVADPEFIAPGNNNYHINAALSPAVDYCDNSLAQATSQDTDRDNRGWDDYTVNNLYGSYDIGADETYDNDIIFKDGLD